MAPQFGDTHWANLFTVIPMKKRLGETSLEEVVVRRGASRPRSFTRFLEDRLENTATGPVEVHIDKRSALWLAVALNVCVWATALVGVLILRG